MAQVAAQKDAWTRVDEIWQGTANANGCSTPHLATGPASPLHLSCSQRARNITRNAPMTDIDERYHTICPTCHTSCVEGGAPISSHRLASPRTMLARLFAEPALCKRVQDASHAGACYDSDPACQGVKRPTKRPVHRFPFPMRAALRNSLRDIRCRQY